MQKIKILTDSTCDIPKEEEKRLGIKIMCFPVTVDGVSYRERQDFSNAEFYKMMDNAKEMPTTSQLTAYEILEVALQRGMDRCNICYNFINRFCNI